MDGHIDPSYIAIIPYPVLAHPELSDGAKLLYGRITMLQRSAGYCFASNEYLASQVGKKADTVSRLVSQLRDAGFLRVEIVRDEKTNEIKERRLYPVLDVAPTSWKNIQEGIGKKSEENNESLESIPPKAPQGGRRRREVKEKAEHKPERFDAFWEFYRKNVRGENKQGALRAWDRLKPSDELIAQMAKALKNQMQSESWKAGIGIPYASTWLNNRRWEDEVKTSATVLPPKLDARGGLEAWD